MIRATFLPLTWVGFPHPWATSSPQDRLLPLRKERNEQKGVKEAFSKVLKSTDSPKRRPGEMSYKGLCWLFDPRFQVSDTVKPHPMSNALSPSGPGSTLSSRPRQHQRNKSRGDRHPHPFPTHQGLSQRGSTPYHQATVGSCRSAAS